MLHGDEGSRQPSGFIHFFFEKADLNTCSRIFIPVVITGINFFLNHQASQMPKKVSRAGASQMSKTNIAPAVKTNGSPVNAEKVAMTVLKKEEPITAASKDLTLMEKILKVENLQLVVEKRSKLVQTRSELERFQISSNDFNCTMRLNDSDGNVFTTSFTPGIKKVIDFLKTSFDASIKDVEDRIRF